MSWTKRQFVIQAFEELGLASYVYDLEAEQLQAALRRLDAMMATWNGQGIRLSYPLPSSPEDADLDTETTVPDSANEAIYLNLAMRLTSPYGKQLAPEVRMSAKAAYNVLLSRATMPNEMQFSDTLPSGAGSKSWDYPFLDKPGTTLDTGPDGEFDFD